MLKFCIYKKSEIQVRNNVLVTPKYLFLTRIQPHLTEVNLSQLSPGEKVSQVRLIKVYADTLCFTYMHRKRNILLREWKDGELFHFITIVV